MHVLVPCVLLHLVRLYTRPLHGGLDGAAPQLSGCQALDITIINIVSNIMGNEFRLFGGAQIIIVAPLDSPPWNLVGSLRQRR